MLFDPNMESRQLHAHAEVFNNPFGASEDHVICQCRLDKYLPGGTGAQHLIAHVTEHMNAETFPPGTRCAGPCPRRDTTHWDLEHSNNGNVHVLKLLSKCPAHQGTATSGSQVIASRHIHNPTAPKTGWWRKH
ncbi:hypothetical protein AB0D94_37160 [Streptomyces sp. NPDC048255]|uniref:hypothetical protein n=1 Tax=Streptomyces sp. NPDC048255 TaxID=3154713 RepID=UPI0033C2FC65